MSREMVSRVVRWCDDADSLPSSCSGRRAGSGRVREVMAFAFLSVPSCQNACEKVQLLRTYINRNVIVSLLTMSIPNKLCVCQEERSANEDDLRTFSEYPGESGWITELTA